MPIEFTLTPISTNELVRDLVTAAGLVTGFIFFLLSQKAATQDRIYAHYTEICKLFMQNPQLRPYFYDRKELLADDPHLRTQIDVMSETILD